MDNFKSIQIPASDFAKCAASGPAWSHLSISSIPQVITDLNSRMEGLGVTAPSHDAHIVHTSPREARRKPNNVRARQVASDW